MPKICGDTICKPIEKLQNNLKKLQKRWQIKPLKVSPRLIFNEMLSCFKPGDSCIILLLCINHETYLSFDHGSEVGSAFLDV